MVDECRAAARAVRKEAVIVMATDKDAYRAAADNAEQALAEARQKFEEGTGTAEEWQDAGIRWADAVVAGLVADGAVKDAGKWARREALVWRVDPVAAQEMQDADKLRNRAFDALHQEDSRASRADHHRAEARWCTALAGCCRVLGDQHSADSFDHLAERHEADAVEVVNKDAD